MAFPQLLQVNDSLHVARKAILTVKNSKNVCEISCCCCLSRLRRDDGSWCFPVQLDIRSFGINECSIATIVPIWTVVFRWTRFVLVQPCPYKRICHTTNMASTYASLGGVGPWLTSSYQPITVTQKYTYTDAICPHRRLGLQWLRLKIHLPQLGDSDDRQSRFWRYPFEQLLYVSAMLPNSSCIVDRKIRSPHWSEHGWTWTSSRRDDVGPRTQIRRISHLHGRKMASWKINFTALTHESWVWFVLRLFGCWWRLFYEEI